MISKWHVKDSVERFQYNVQNFQHHFNDPLSQKGEKAHTQYASKAALTAHEDRQAGLLHNKVLAASSSPFVTGRIQGPPALPEERKPARARRLRL